MNGLPIQVIIVLLGIAVLALLWLVMRFSRTIALVVLVLGLLAVAVLGAASLVTQAAANYQTAKIATDAMQAVKVASVGQSVTTVIVALGVGIGVGVMGAITMGALGTAGYFALRLNWNNSQKLTARDLLNPGWRRQSLPETVQPGQVIYLVEEDDSVDLSGIELAEWGW